MLYLPCKWFISFNLQDHSLYRRCQWHIIPSLSSGKSLHLITSYHQSSPRSLQKSWAHVSGFFTQSSKVVQRWRDIKYERIHWHTWPEQSKKSQKHAETKAAQDVILLNCLYTSRISSAWLGCQPPQHHHGCSWAEMLSSKHQLVQVDINHHSIPPKQALYLIYCIIYCYCYLFILILSYHVLISCGKQLVTRTTLHDQKNGYLESIAKS